MPDAVAWGCKQRTTFTDFYAPTATSTSDTARIRTTPAQTRLTLLIWILGPIVSVLQHQTASTRLQRNAIGPPCDLGV